MVKYFAKLCEEKKTTEPSKTKQEGIWHKSSYDQALINVTKCVYVKTDLREITHGQQGIIPRISPIMTYHS